MTAPVNHTKNKKRTENNKTRENKIPETGHPEGVDTPRPLSLVLEELRQNLRTMDHVTIGVLIEALHERGIGVLLFIFAAPMALPIPVPPPLNVILASPLLLLAGQQALGRHTIWMPEKTRQRFMPRDKLIKMLDHLVSWVEKLEYLIRPRLAWLSHHLSNRIFGAMAVLMALTICIPFPLTNTVPSFGIALIAIGTTMRDGLVILAGAVVGMAWLCLLAGAVLIFGPEAVEIIKGAIKSLL